MEIQLSSFVKAALDGSLFKHLFPLSFGPDIDNLTSLSSLLGAFSFPLPKKNVTTVTFIETKKNMRFD